MKQPISRHPHRGFAIDRKIGGFIPRPLLERIVVEQVRLKMFVAASIIFCVWLTACDSDGVNSADNAKQLAEIAQFMGVEFPADAKIVHVEKNDRNNEVVYYHIIYTRMPVKFKEPPVAKITAADSTKHLKKVVGRRTIGKLADQWKYCYEGNVKDGAWSAYQTIFETGSYLEVEQFYF
jgi:hypothetical protein